MESSFDMVAMLMLGLLGTGHCIGMCGPLVVAFPGRGGGFCDHLAYHGGRLTTYTLAGALLAGLVSGMAHLPAMAGDAYLIWIARSQVFFSLLAALFLLIFGLVRLGIVGEPGWMNYSAPMRIPFLARQLQRSPRQGRSRGMFGLGLMLGLLPCGLSFGALARCLPAGSAWEGAMLMGAFGLGTLPGLLLLGTGLSHVIRRYRRQSDLLAGLLMFMMGIELAYEAVLSLLSPPM